MPSPTRVLVVTDGAADLPADTARQVRDAWQASAPHTVVEGCAAHDGGAGLAALLATWAGERATTHPVTVPGPDGVEVPAGLVVLDLPGQGRTVVLDTAQVAGRHLVPAARLEDPVGFSSAGIGELLRLARDLRPDHVVVGIGPLACHDGGTGLLTALGAGEDLSGLPAVRRDWAQVPLTVAVTTEGPLLGFHGASATLGELGVAPAVTQRLESELGALTDRVNTLLPPATDLLTGQPRRPERQIGAGAGGGAAYALQLLGARTTTGARLCLDLLGIGTALARADLLVLVTDSYDHRVLDAGVVADLGRAAVEAATPVVVLSRASILGRREGMALGVVGSYATRGEETPADLAGRVARTWTPRPNA